MGGLHFEVRSVIDPVNQVARPNSHRGKLQLVIKALAPAEHLEHLVELGSAVHTLIIGVSS